MAFSRQEYWSGLPFPSLGDLPDPGIESRSSALQADSLPSQPPVKPKRLHLQRSHLCVASAMEKVPMVMGGGLLSTGCSGGNFIGRT